MKLSSFRGWLQDCSSSSRTAALYGNGFQSVASCRQGSSKDVANHPIATLISTQRNIQCVSRFSDAFNTVI